MGALKNLKGTLKGTLLGTLKRTLRGSFKGFLRISVRAPLRVLQAFSTGSSIIGFRFRLGPQLYQITGTWSRREPQEMSPKIPYENDSCPESPIPLN